MVFYAVSAIFQPLDFHFLNLLNNSIAQILTLSTRDSESHRSSMKQFQSINIFAQSIDYTFTSIKQKINSFLRINWSLICYENKSHHPKMLCAELGWNWSNGSGEFFFISSNLIPLPARLFSAKFSWNWPSVFTNEILLFRYYLPVEKGVTFHLTKPKTPLCKDDLCQVWLKLAQWFWRRRLFAILLFSPFGAKYLIHPWFMWITIRRWSGKPLKVVQKTMKIVFQDILLYTQSHRIISSTKLYPILLYLYIL